MLAQLDLCATLTWLSTRTWRALELGTQHIVPWHEPTITQVNLLDLAIRHPTEVRVFPYSTRIEGNQTGADWEWWIGRSGSWIGLRVQAKKLDTPSLRYPELAKVTYRRPQVDRLINDAVQNKRHPIYCFYNYWNPVFAVPWNCRSFAPDPALLGCAIADAYPIQSLVRGKRDALGDVLPLCLPWSCIACCPGGMPPGGRTVDRIVAVLQNLPGAGDGMPVTVHTSLPRYVEALLQGETEVEGIPDIPYVVVTRAPAESDTHPQGQDPEYWHTKGR